MKQDGEPPVSKKQWWQFTIHNPHNARVNPSSTGRFEFPSIDPEGAEKLGEYYAFRFPGFEPGKTVVLLYSLTTSPPSEM